MRAREHCWLLRIDGKGLRALCELDERLTLVLTRGVAQAAIEQLHTTELLLAAAHREANPNGHSVLQDSFMIP